MSISQSPWKRMRESVKRIPFFGHFLHRVYLVLRYREYSVVQIEGGLLKGIKLYRFMRTTYASYIRGDKEPDLQEAIAANLRPGDTFFDIGSHGGFFSLLAARLVGPTGKVVAFEAHPLSAIEIKKQFRLNRFSWASVVSAAICDRNGKAEFADDRAADQLSLAELRKDATPLRTVSVTCTTLDDQVAKLGVPKAIKVDVEGAEELVLRGATCVLVREFPILFIELHSEEIRNDCMKRLNEMGYSAFNLSGAELDDVNFTRVIMCKRKRR